MFFYKQVVTFWCLKLTFFLKELHHAFISTMLKRGEKKMDISEGGKSTWAPA